MITMLPTLHPWPHSTLPPFRRGILGVRPAPPQKPRKSAHGSDVTSQSNGISDRPPCPLPFDLPTASSYRLNRHPRR
jgi:hypothetical protein